MASKPQQETAEAMTAATMKTELMQITLDELKDASGPWAKLSERQQSDLLSRLDQRIGEAISSALELFATAACAHARATLDQVVIKDGIKVQLSLGRYAAERHDVVDAQGQSVYIVLANPEQFTDAPHEQQPDADQPDLELAESPA